MIDLGGGKYRSREDIDFGLRLAKVLKDQIDVEHAFMWGKEEKTEGMYSALLKRGILEKVWSDAK